MITPKIPNTKWLAENFNLTPEKWKTIFDFQKGLCAICKNPLDKVINTDHDHKSGLIRGLLCFRCNQALRESITLDFVIRTLEYLSNPPATEALGKPVFGLPGRVGTKLRRKLIKKLKKVYDEENSINSTNAAGPIHSRVK